MKKPSQLWYKVAITSYRAGLPFSLFYFGEESINILVKVFLKSAETS